VTRAANVRRMTWAALAVASAVLVAVVTEATRTTAPPPSPRPAVPAAPPAPSVDAMPIAVVAGETPPAIIDWDAPKVGPDEPAIETGSSTIALQLRDADTGAPVDVKFVLWRLGVAADEFWSAGDQEYAKASTVAGAARIEHLPQGRYRLCVDDQRKGAQDPPEFAVGAGVNEIEQVIRPVRTFHLRVLVVDDAGAPVASGSLRHTSGGSHGSSHPSLSWASPRVPLWLGEPQSAYVSRWGDSVGERTARPVRSVAGVFDLATFHESSRNYCGDDSWEFEPVAGERLLFRVDSDSAADATFVYVTTRIAVLVAHVTTPDGAKLDPRTAKIGAACGAVPCAWPPPPDAWRNFPVHVRVSRPGCETLTFAWTAATADVEHRLVAAAPESPK
jgi:hypothetical protein